MKHSSNYFYLEVITGDKTSESNVSKPASDKTPDLNKPKDLITSSDLGKSRIEELRSPTTSHSPVVKTQCEKDLNGVPDISEAEDKKVGVYIFSQRKIFSPIYLFYNEL